MPGSFIDGIDKSDCSASNCIAWEYALKADKLFVLADDACSPRKRRNVLRLAWRAAERATVNGCRAVRGSRLDRLAGWASAEQKRRLDRQCKTVLGAEGFRALKDVEGRDADPIDIRYALSFRD